MTPVLDKVTVTSPGQPSQRAVSEVAMAEADWIAAYGGATAAESPPAYAAVSENDYLVQAPLIRCALEEREGGGFLVVEQETGIFGSGPDQNLAFHDLFKALYEHLDVLERQESLSPGLAEQRDYLRSIL